MSSEAQRNKPHIWLVATAEAKGGLWGQGGSLIPSVQDELGTLVYNQPVCSPSSFRL